MSDDLPFWKTKKLHQMSREEWESLCDGCGRCCLVKLYDEDDPEMNVHYTSVHCTLLDSRSCRCSDYPNRRDKVPGCTVLTPDNLGAIKWMPSTCGYRLIREGKDLEWWHPLVSGDANTVHDAGISVRGKVVSEDDVPETDLFKFLITWAR